MKNKNEEQIRNYINKNIIKIKNSFRSSFISLFQYVPCLLN